MPPEAQTRLLRVLQEGEFTSVGGRQPIKADVRIIAATHRDLRQRDPPGPVPRGSVLPAERRADPPAAAARAGRGHPAAGPPLPGARAARTGCRPRRSTRARSTGSSSYRWPGNVRELENLMRRLAALCPHETIGAEQIAAELVEAAPAPSEAPAARRAGAAGARGGAAYPRVPRRPSRRRRGAVRHL